MSVPLYLRKEKSRHNECAGQGRRACGLHHPHCGFVKTGLDLSERTYICEACGLVLDRDYNASLNIMQAGAVSSGVPVESAASC